MCPAPAASTCRASPKRSGARGPLIRPAAAGQDRWRPPGSSLSRPHAGHLLRRPALHRLSRHQPAAPGGHRQDRTRRPSPTSTSPASRASRSATIRAWCGATRRAPGSNTQFGGAVNTDPVALKARNRLAIVESRRRLAGLLPALPQILLRARNRNQPGLRLLPQDSDNSFAVGVRQADREESYKPYGVSDEVWDKRAHEARHDINNFALYNAPPGTMQRMAVYFYLSPGQRRATQEAVMAFTHDDVYKPVPGYQVHGQPLPHPLQRAAHRRRHHRSCTRPGCDVFRGLGINIAILADFHSDSHPNDPGQIRFAGAEGLLRRLRRFSDREFLLIPGEEPDATLGGHYITIMPHPVYWSQTRASPASSSSRTIRRTARSITSPPRPKSSTCCSARTASCGRRTRAPRAPPAIPTPSARRPHFLSDRFLGASFQSLPVDQSQKRICEERCLGLLDDMNNWPPTEIPDRRRRHLHEVSRRRNLPAAVRQLRQARPRPEIRRGLEPRHPRHARRRFLRHQRRSAAAQLGPWKERRAPHVHRRRGMDLPAGIRRAGLGRWRDHPTRRSFRPPNWRLSAPTSSAFPSMPRARNGCASRPGIPPATAPSPSPCISTNEDSPGCAALSARASRAGCARRRTSAGASAGREAESR